MFAIETRMLDKDKDYTDAANQPFSAADQGYSGTTGSSLGLQARYVDSQQAPQKR